MCPGLDKGFLAHHGTTEAFDGQEWVVPSTASPRFKLMQSLSDWIALKPQIMPHVEDALKYVVYYAYRRIEETFRLKLNAWWWDKQPASQQFRPPNAAIISAPEIAVSQFFEFLGIGRAN